MNDDERIESLYHGTTLAVAPTLHAQKRIQEQPPVSQSTGHLHGISPSARALKRRTDRPALLVTQVYLNHIRSCRQRGLVHHGATTNTKHLPHDVCRSALRKKRR